MWAKLVQMRADLLSSLLAAWPQENERHCAKTCYRRGCAAKQGCWPNDRKLLDSTSGRALQACSKGSLTGSTAPAPQHRQHRKVTASSTAAPAQPHLVATQQPLNLSC